MPIYITDSRVDWGWAERTDAERAIIRRYQPTLDDSTHGIESFSKLLEAATRELRSIEVVAIVEEDGGGECRLLIARDGRVDEERPETHRARVEALLATDKSDLFPVTVPWAERVANAAAPSQKFEQRLYFPREMLDDIADLARRLDKSHSWIVQKAWQLARDAIAGAPDRAAAAALRSGPPGSSRPQAQTLYYPGPMLVEMQAEATRFDSSMSWVVQLAFDVARNELAGLGPKRGVVIDI
jgi:uncharacterized small protein (TIGR04563 family)